MLEGLSGGHLTDAELDRLAAFVAADKAIKPGTTSATPTTGRPRSVQSRARSLAAEATRALPSETSRPPPAWAPRTPFRLIGSKEALLPSIMGSFGEKVDAGSKCVLQTDASPIEKLDALSWVDTNALECFGDEFRIQPAWMRQLRPDTPHPNMEFAKRIRQIKSLLSAGIRSDDIKVDDVPLEMLARCVIVLRWIPANILGQLGTRAALIHARDTMLRGVTLSREDGQLRPAPHT
jgi:hypothetical protein